MKRNYFQGNKDHPQHISVGAVIMNEKGEVCCHHFIADTLSGYWADEMKKAGMDDFYLLMRETLLPNETVETALQRGMRKEFGISAEMIDYIGSVRSHFMHQGIEVEKMTLYFICRLVSWDLTKRDTSDIEGTTKIEWQKPGFLIPKMKGQAIKFGRTDVDESSILERALGYFS